MYVLCHNAGTTADIGLIFGSEVPSRGLPTHQSSSTIVPRSMLLDDQVSMLEHRRGSSDRVVHRSHQSSRILLGLPSDRHDRSLNESDLAEEQVSVSKVDQNVGRVNRGSDRANLHDGSGPGQTRHNGTTAITA